jgi:hypothetical protein
MDPGLCRGRLRGRGPWALGQFRFFRWSEKRIDGIASGRSASQRSLSVLHVCASIHVFVVRAWAQAVNDAAPAFASELAASLPTMPTCTGVQMPRIFHPVSRSSAAVAAAAREYWVCEAVPWSVSNADWLSTHRYAVATGVSRCCSALRASWAACSSASKTSARVPRWQWSANILRAVPLLTQYVTHPLPVWPSSSFQPSV